MAIVYTWNVSQTNYETANGFITTAHALLTNEPNCDENRIREVLSGNLCRCTGYVPIVRAVLDARIHYQNLGGE